MNERSLILVKPDGVVRGLSGSIIDKIEKTGLKLVAIKMVVPDKKLVERHYPWDMKWAQNIWDKTTKAYAAKGVKVKDKDAEAMGRRIRNDIMSYLVGKPVVAMVFEGNDAVLSIRKITGATSPHLADPGSVRGMYSTDSYDLADAEHRSTICLMHASDSVETANREIPVWFTNDEIIKYKRVDEDLIYHGIFPK